MKKIQEKFYATNSSVFDYVYMQIEDNFIPEDIFINHGVINISLSGKIPDQYHPEIHPEAFRSCQNVLQYFRLASLDMSKMNFSFLTGFHQLTKLEMTNMINTHLTAFPLLQNLKELSVSNSARLAELFNFSFCLNGFEKLILQHIGLTDEDADQILKWIASGPSKETLNYLDLSGNALTRISQHIKLLSGLEILLIGDQTEPGFGVVPAFSFYFHHPIRLLNLSSCYITEIQPEAFQGFISTF